MKAIWKYRLNNDKNYINLPSGYKVLSVINQNNVIVLYCLVDTENVSVKVQFDIIGTGLEFFEEHFDNKKFVGTVSTHEGKWIWHVFQVL